MPRIMYTDAPAVPPYVPVALFCLLAAASVLGCKADFMANVDSCVPGADMGSHDAFVCGTDADIGRTDSVPMPGPVACDSSLVNLLEIEPNEEPPGTVIGSPVTLPGVCVIGSAVCGNDGDAYTGGVDWYSFQIGLSMTVRFTLSWNVWQTDMDMLLYSDPATKKLPLIPHEKGTNPVGESGIETTAIALMANTDYFIRVGCWEGQDGEYALALVAE